MTRAGFMLCRFHLAMCGWHERRAGALLGIRDARPRRMHSLELKAGYTAAATIALAAAAIYGLFCLVRWSPTVGFAISGLLGVSLLWQAVYQPILGALRLREIRREQDAEERADL